MLKFTPHDATTPFLHHSFLVQQKSLWLFEKNKLFGIMKKNKRVIVALVIFFHPTGLIPHPVCFFHSRRWTKLIKNKLCKKSHALFTVCQFALSAVGCFLFLLYRSQFSVGIFAGCQSTFVHCQGFQFAGWQVVGLFGVFHQVAASFQHFLSRLC